MANFKDNILIFCWLIYKKFQLLTYYMNISSSIKNYDRFCVLKIDGRVRHGGLCDRLKSAVTIYAICKANKIPFKIYFSSPFKLEEILIPNEYNWLINESELTKSIFNTKILTSYTGNLKLTLKSKIQIHVYNFGGGYIEKVNSQYHTDYSFSSIFKELFIPNEILKEKLNKLATEIGGPYIAVTYRFQSLLGDFYEGKYFHKKALSYTQKDRTAIIESSIYALTKIKERHPNIPILVTSDSSTFLSLVSTIENIVVIPGENVHMDFTSNAVNKTYMKAFIDFFMLIGAEKIYSVSGMGLYKSGFPKVAAKVSNKEIESIELK